MSVAVPLIAAGIGAAGQYFSGRTAAKAAEKAATQQVEAADKAAAVQAPWLAGGAQAQNTLAGLMGFAPSVPAGGAIAGPLTGVPVPEARPRQPVVEEGKAPVRSRREAPAPGQTLAQLAATTRSQSGYSPGAVRMRAPDGRVVLVPKARVAEAQAQGGQVVA